MTASEPLTLQEEYDMQQSWHLDDNSKANFSSPSKSTWSNTPAECTFIILALPPPGTTSEELRSTTLSKAGAGSTLSCIAPIFINTYIIDQYDSDDWRRQPVFQ